jgi:hypothetical protein
LTLSSLARTLASVRSLATGFFDGHEITTLPE